MEVDDPDEPVGRRDERHREHRRVAVAAEGGDVLVPGIRPFVVSDDHRLPVLRDPPRHALAQGEGHRAHDLAIRLARCPEHQATAVVRLVEVQEAGIDARRLQDQVHGGGQDALQVDAGGEHLDDPVESPVLLLGHRQRFRLAAFRHADPLRLAGPAASGGP